MLRLRFGLILGAQRRLLWLPGVAIWTIVEFLGGLVIYHFHHAYTNPEIKPYRYLCAYPSKDSSAWIEVWSIPWPSKAPITAPKGRDLGDFRVSGLLAIYNSRHKSPITGIKSYLHLSMSLYLL